ncbi:MFS transporter [Flexivirga caeni]|uniref:MFS transporter n=2 Tax=Flexivirga caeni TaxID=2294115 RepID=A0A3M9M9R3_9MICO|nr:MFS transporter [Flexivirga caeni]
MAADRRATAPTPPDDAVARRVSRSVAVLFVLNGAAFATFAARLPDVKNMLHLSAAGLGLFLLAGSIGSVSGLPLAGWVISRIGTRATVRVAATAAVCGYAVAGFAITAHLLWLAVIGLLVAGMGIGPWDVTMNLEGTVVERHEGRSIMPRYHAMFSGGTVLAALIGVAATGLHVPLWAHLTAAMAIIGTLALTYSRNFELLSDTPEMPEATPVPDTPRAPSHRSAWTDPRVLLIGVVTLVAGFTEGSANDWLSLGFVEGHGVPKWAGVLAFATFLTCMTGGRLLGTGLLDRYGRVPTLRVCFALAVLGCLMVVFGTTPLAYAGVVVWGVGVSLGFPVGMSAAADDPARAHARISVISTIAYTAFLAGPPLLGLLGEHVGVLHALLAVGAAATLALFLVPAVREPAATDVTAQ